ncbi:hypothetical protein H696_01926 [Fonticula alba]|uniref:WW domain-containing protein n=1 Tax=Fonticula alba TaxID=691883 RepID=A0A058Z9M1_FONAL|nr:hypothetical protein H696_01926 [Fonticula alba]KCV70979.1 hypothetical protein H696_01926 [Fonticula alba]|eukprot:XP_009494102.1 hypothetical protein H696_01926 [Fonticula alba]
MSTATGHAVYGGGTGASSAASSRHQLPYRPGLPTFQGSSPFMHNEDPEDGRQSATGSPESQRHAGSQKFADPADFGAAPPVLHSGLSSGWTMEKDPSGRRYFSSSSLQSTSWFDPRIPLERYSSFDNPPAPAFVRTAKYILRDSRQYGFSFLDGDRLVRSARAYRKETSGARMRKGDLEKMVRQAMRSARDWVAQGLQESPYAKPTPPADPASVTDAAVSEKDTELNAAAGRVTDRVFSLLDLEYQQHCELRSGLIALAFMSRIRFRKKLEVVADTLDTTGKRMLTVDHITFLLETLHQLIEHPDYRYRLLMPGQAKVQAKRLLLVAATGNPNAADQPAVDQSGSIILGRRAGDPEEVSATQLADYIIGGVEHLRKMAKSRSRKRDKNLPDNLVEEFELELPDPPGLPPILRAFRMMERIDAAERVTHEGTICAACSASPIQGLLYELAKPHSLSPPSSRGASHDGTSPAPGSSAGPATDSKRKLSLRFGGGRSRSTGDQAAAPGGGTAATGPGAAGDKAPESRTVSAGQAVETTGTDLCADCFWAGRGPATLTPAAGAGAGATPPSPWLLGTLSPFSRPLDADDASGSGAKTAATLPPPLSPGLVAVERARSVTRRRSAGPSPLSQQAGAADAAADAAKKADKKKSGMRGLFRCVPGGRGRASRCPHRARQTGLAMQQRGRAAHLAARREPEGARRSRPREALTASGVTPGLGYMAWGVPGGRAAIRAQTTHFADGH